MVKKENKNEDITSESEFFEALAKAKKDKKGISIVFNEAKEEEKKDTKNPTIAISKMTEMCLDNLRREIVEIVSRTNDLELMKKVEKCSYDKLILLLNIGFSEKAFYDTLNGKSEMKAVDIAFTSKSREVLNELLKEEEKNTGEKNDKKI